MSKQPEGRSPHPQSELSPGHCPNCGRRLKFPENRPEGLCASCGIYVEILQPLAPPAAPPLDRSALQSSLKRDLVRLCEERGLDPDGSKAELVRRLLEHLERNPPGPQETVVAPESPLAAPEPSSTADDVAKRKEAAVFFLSLEQALEESEEPAAPVPSPEAAQAPPEPSATPSPEPAAETPQAATAGEVTSQTAPAEEVKASEDVTSQAAHAEEATAPEEAAPQTAPAEEVRPSEETEAPRAETDPALPQEFDELFDDEEYVEVEEVPEPPEPPVEDEAVVAREAGIVAPAWAEPPRAAEETAAVVKARRLAIHLRRDRAIFYVGLVASLFGGVGLLLGSFIHDFMRVPMFGFNFGVFGSLNTIAALMGAMFLAAGLAAIGVASRGGVIRAKPAPGA